MVVGCEVCNNGVVLIGMAAKLIGHKELEEKMVEGRTKLRRGIVFSASL